MFGYKRAAAAIFRLETSLTDLVREHEDALPRISGIGPASAGINWTIDRLMAWIAEPTREAADPHLFTTEPFHHQ